MNIRLADMQPTSPEAAAYWRGYNRRWTRLNHVRAIGATTTAVMYFVAMLWIA